MPRPRCHAAAVPSTSRRLLAAPPPFLLRRFFSARLAILTIAFVASVVAVVDAAQSADQVRDNCVKAFELAFPKQRWTSEDDLRAFVDNVSTDQPNYFACPYGAEVGSLENFTPGDLLEWFLANFNPNRFKYTEIIMSDVSVVGSTCSLDKLFFAEFGGKCHVQAMSRLLLEVDDDGKLVRWMDHFDREDLNQKMGVCNLQMEVLEGEDGGDNGGGEL